MANRREFIHNTFAAALMAGLGHAPGVLAFDGKERAISIYKAIFDSRFPDGRRFAEEARWLGINTHAISGDITDLWFNDLDTRWRADRATVAGLTTEAALFCLERFSWDHQMRVVFRAEHERVAADCIEHTLSCSRAGLDHVQTLGDAGSQWATRLAHVLQDIPAGGAPEAAHAFTTLPADATNPAPELLVSWVIAPMSRTCIRSNEPSP